MFTEENNQCMTIESRFHKMMEPSSIKLAKPFLNEEREALIKFLDSLKASYYNLCFIGDAIYLYCEIANKYAENYLVIDPMARLNTPGKVIFKQFQEIQMEELPVGKNVFVFPFNVLYYIPDPIKELKRLTKKGDSIFISGWNNTSKAVHVMSRYFTHIDEDLMHFPDLPTLKHLDFCGVGKTERISLSICDIIVVTI